MADGEGCLKVFACGDDYRCETMDRNTSLFPCTQLTR